VLEHEQPQEPGFLDIVGLGAMNVDYIVGGTRSKKQWAAISDGDRVSDKEKLQPHFRMFQETLDGLHPESRSVVYGGSTFNTLQALHHMDVGMRLGFAGVLGNLPDGLRGGLLDPAAELSRLQIEHGGPDGHEGRGNMVVSFVSGGDRYLYTYFDPTVPKSFRLDASSIAAFVARARVVHVTSIYGNGAAKVFTGILEEARTIAESEGRQLLVSLDPGDEWTRQRATDGDLKRLFKTADYLFLNESELRQLGGETQTDREIAAGALKRIAPRASLIVLKKWDSAVIYERHNRSIRELVVEQNLLPAARIADPTGAGDVFAAGFLAALLSPRGVAVGAASSGLLAARIKLEGFAAEGYDDLKRAYSGTPRSPRGKIFISHAFADARFAQALEQLLRDCGVDKGLIFNSDSDEQGIRANRDIVTTLHRELDRADWVISLLSATFTTRPFCMYETGAAWQSGKRTFRLSVGQIDELQLDLLLGQTTLVATFVPRTLEILRDDLVESGHMKPVAPEVWDGACRRAMEAVEAREEKTRL
jgi:sugar/nucleoside kinase (ribokinase family)